MIKKKQLQVIKVITDIEVNKNSKDPKDESTPEKHENENDTAIRNDEKAKEENASYNQHEQNNNNEGDLKIHKSNIIQNSKK